MIDEATKVTGYSELRDYQRKTMQACLCGRGVFVSAPTGARKSLTSVCLERIVLQYRLRVLRLLVPPISLMKDQVSDLNRRGIRASYVGDDCSEQQLEDILNLRCKLVFGSPEAILNNYRHIFRRLKKKKKKKKN